MDEAADAGLARGAGQVAAADRVDPVEDPLVGEPLLGQAHRVEDQLAALDRGRQGLGVEGVALHTSTPLGEHRRGAGGVADQHPDLVAALEQGGGDRVADLSGGAGDECLHVGLILVASGYMIGSYVGPAPRDRAVAVALAAAVM